MVKGGISGGLESSLQTHHLISLIELELLIKNQRAQTLKVFNQLAPRIAFNVPKEVIHMLLLKFPFSTLHVNQGESRIAPIFFPLATVIAKGSILWN